MIGGYYKWDEDEVIDSMKELSKWGVVPPLSCGFNPGLTDYVTEKVGIDYMANVEEQFHGHPCGTICGPKAMRQSVDGTHGDEYQQAIEKWGKK